MISVAAVAEYLEGLDFPATKQEIIDYADDRHAPPEVLDALYEMPDPPDGMYYSMASVWDALSEIM